MQVRRSHALLAHAQALILFMLSCCAVALTSCNSSTNASTPTPTPVLTVHPKIALKSGDLTLCTVVSEGDFSHIVAATVSKIAESVTSEGAVECNYQDVSASISRGNIEYRIYADSSSAKNAYNAAQSSAKGQSPISSLGDSAFWAPRSATGTTPAGAVVAVLSSKLVLTIQTNGDPSTAWPEGQRLAELALSRVG